ncbi:MAG: alpha/beta hydrolase [Verrucomicrobiales bacterium]|nr:alpha/beta hydrolase [Verrucomicrobiales bacterium]
MKFGFPLLCVLISNSLSGQEVEVLKNIPFTDHGPKLDLYLPPEDGSIGLRPAVLIVHGGGWHGGDKAAAREKNIGTNLAKAGYVCASINYVLAKKTDLLTENLKQVWPRNLNDCMQGVIFLRKNAREYRIDPERIGAIGGSAGGHLVAMLGAVSDGDALDLEGEKFSARVQAVVPMYGVHDLISMAEHRKIETDAETVALLKQASPVTHLSKDDPPLLILHGTRDTLVPRAQSKALHEAAEKAGIESELHIIKGAKHSFHFEPPQKDLKPLVVKFFDKHLKGKSGR